MTVTFTFVLCIVTFQLNKEILGHIKQKFFYFMEEQSKCQPLNWSLSSVLVKCNSAVRHGRITTSVRALFSKKSATRQLLILYHGYPIDLMFAFKTILRYWSRNAHIPYRTLLRFRRTIFLHVSSQAVAGPCMQLSECEREEDRQHSSHTSLSQKREYRYLFSPYIQQSGHIRKALWEKHVLTVP